MKYKINIRYTTGNSFGTHTEDEQLPYEWDNIQDVEKAIKYINEHHLSYIEYKKLRNGKEEKQFSTSKSNKEWYVKSEYSTDFSYQINLPIDSGKLHTFGCFWHGYFERLESVSIIVSGDSYYEY